MRLIATLVASVVASTACASTLPPARAPSPAELARMEAAVARDSNDVAALVALGAAYRAAGRPEDARPRLERAARLRPDDATAAVFLGLIHEEAGEPGQARVAYQRYIDLGSSERVRRHLRQRLDLLARQEIVALARRLAQQEGAAAAEAPSPGTVAIFPFLYVGADPQYRPLERALAEMLVTDLSQTDRLTVLERLHVQALLDELRLSGSDVVDPATAARSGRLLGAERVVQGSIAIEPGALQLSAAVVGATGAAARTAPVTAEDVQRLLDAEKRLALALYQSMGIELTVAERERVEQRATTNVQALLAYGEGLEAEDRGDYAAAAAHFARATRLDPGFTLASESGARTTALVEAQAVGVNAVAQQVAAELGIGAASPFDLAPPPPSLDALTSASADPMRRDAAVEALGVEGIALRTLLRIVFRRP